MPEKPESALEFTKKILRAANAAIQADGDKIAKARKRLCGRGALLILPGELWVSAGERRPAALEKLIEEADRDPVSYDAARELAALDLAGGLDLAPPLRKFAADVLSLQARRPTRKGPSRYANVRRDKIFAWLVYILGRKFGLYPYRNDESESLSTCACDLITAAAQAEGLEASYDAVRNAWRKFKHTFPPRKPV